MRKQVRKGIERRVPLTADEKSNMLAILIRKESAYLRAASVLTPEHFHEQEAWMSAIWLITTDYHGRHNRLPSERLLTTLFNSYTENDPDLLSEDDYMEAEKFLSFAWEDSVDDLNEQVAFDWLQRFLEDRLVDVARQDLSLPQTPEDLSEVFEQYHAKATQYKSIGTPHLSRPFAPGWDQKEVVFDVRRTSIDFLDAFMHGGHAAKESHGLLGPYGGGKTTLGVQITVGAAEMAYLAWRDRGKTGPMPVAYHVSYEAPPMEVKLRALSHLCKIPKSKLEEVYKVMPPNYKVLSTDDRLCAEDTPELCQNMTSSGRILGERSRWRWGEWMLDKFWQLIDMTGAGDGPSRGYGLVDEIAAIVRQDLSIREGHLASVVLVDYVLAAVEKHLDFHNKDHSELRHYVNRWPMHIKNKVAIPFNCPVWSLHQLNTEANAFKPGQVPKSTDSSEGKAFAENLDFLFAIGKADKDNRAVFVCSKFRRVAPPPLQIVRLDGELATISRADGFAVDEHRRQIIPASELSRVDGGRADDGEEAPARRTRRVRRQAISSQQAALRRNSEHR